MTNIDWPLATVLIVAVICLTIVLLSIIEALTGRKDIIGSKEPVKTWESIEESIEKGGDNHG